MSGPLHSRHLLNPPSSPPTQRAGNPPPPPTHVQRISSSEGDQIRTPTSTRPHAHPVSMATPAPWKSRPHRRAAGHSAVAERLHSAPKGMAVWERKTPTQPEGGGEGGVRGHTKVCGPGLQIRA